MTEEHAYNTASQSFKDRYHVEYGMLYAECRARQATIRAEAEADRFWSEAADTERYLYDCAIRRLQVLDNAAHKAGMDAIAALALHELAS